MMVERLMEKRKAEKLKKLLREKAEEPLKRLPIFKFEKEGTELFCKFIGKRPSPWKEGSYVYDVEDIETGEKYTLPRNVLIYRFLEENQPNAGDYLYFKYTGMRTWKGRRVKLFECSMIPKEEAEEMIKEKPQKIPEEKIPELKSLVNDLALLRNEISIGEFERWIKRVLQIDVKAEDVIKELNLRTTQKDQVIYVVLR